MRLTLVEPPVPFITLDEAKAHCRVDHSDEDLLLQQAIDAAISHLDGYRGILRRCIVNQVWRLDVARPYRTVRLPFPDISAVSVAFTDEPSGAVPFEQAHDGLALTFGGVLGRPIAITFTAGFGPAEDVPAAIKIAALMLVNFFYNQRGGDGEGIAYPPEVDAMVSQFKVWRV